MDSLNANASKLRAFKAQETLGDIVKRVYEIIEIEHEEENISGYGNILVYKNGIHPREHVSVEKKILLSVAVFLGKETDVSVQNVRTKKIHYSCYKM